MGRILALLFACLGIFGLTRIMSGHSGDDPGLVFACALFSFGAAAIILSKGHRRDDSHRVKKDAKDKELKKLQGELADVREEMKVLRENLADLTLMLHESQQTARLRDADDRKGKM